MTSHKPSMPHVRHNLTPVNNRYYLTGEEVPEGVVSVGMKVGYAKYAGLMYKGKDNKDYRMINYGDLVCKLDDDMKLIDPHLLKGRTQ